MAVSASSFEVAPGFAAFRESWARGRTVLLHQERPADLETPVSVFLKLAGTKPYSSLFESVEGGVTIGRHSFISTDADLVWRARGGRAERFTPSGARSTDALSAPEADAPLESLRRLIHETQFARSGAPLKMAGGLVGFLGYDAVRGMERLPDLGKPSVSRLPDGLFFRPRLTAIFDRVGDRLTLVSVARPDADGARSAESAWEEGVARLASAWDRLDAPAPQEPSASFFGASPGFRSAVAPAAYEAMVERARAYIRAGDIYQVVLSQRFSARSAVAPFDFYRALRRINPAPFLFFLRLEDASVAGSSPEVLVRVDESGRILVRPLAGTRPRGADESEDLALEQDLLSDPKERAEHLMLLDLGRNDVGRVAVPGSVSVPRRFVVERYSRVMHISSTVTGRLALGKTALDALISAFPAGTLSGAPKVRAMEIIEELEPSRRGLYGGAVGYFGPDGSLDSCIALRTAVLEGGGIHVQAGAGIVADSDPASERRECLSKASALFAAAEEAGKVRPAPLREAE